MARTIKVETTLDTSSERVWDAMKHPASFVYVTKGIVGFPALAGRTDPIREGETGSGWILLFHLLPLYRHTIEVVDLDETDQTIRSHEYGGVLRRWDHTLHVEPIDDEHCRYSDTVEIDAGTMTSLVARSAVGIYRYRQRRWRRLVAKHLRVDGPAYQLNTPS